MKYFPHALHVKVNNHLPTNATFLRTQRHSGIKECRKFRELTRWIRLLTLSESVVAYLVRP